MNRVIIAALKQQNYQPLQEYIAHILDIETFADPTNSSSQYFQLQFSNETFDLVSLSEEELRQVDQSDLVFIPADLLLEEIEELLSGEYSAIHSYEPVDIEEEFTLINDCASDGCKLCQITLNNFSRSITSSLPQYLSSQAREVAEQAEKILQDPSYYFNDLVVSVTIERVEDSQSIDKEEIPSSPDQSVVVIDIELPAFDDLEVLDMVNQMKVSARDDLINSLPMLLIDNQLPHHSKLLYNLCKHTNLSSDKLEYYILSKLINAKVIDVNYRDFYRHTGTGKKRSKSTISMQISLVDEIISDFFPIDQS